MTPNETQNVNVNGAMAELEAQRSILGTRCATLAGEAAVLKQQLNDARAENSRLSTRIAELEPGGDSEDETE